ncbi:PREDICTED: uncharacterized protein LOC109163417 [Ipomoea nil]|uniref:uncharacterized protein LOC109163417 n=1 Tax=Ipomoea nil TaxID=35883 RepID=UPI000900D8F4|nr:PREDICTED: uncharacterized protein LOC109163417 [Ipomoea nil]
MWRLLRRLLPFPNVLQSFGFWLPSVCPICLAASSSMEHCLYHCSGVQMVWRHFDKIFGFGSRGGISVREVFQNWWLHDSSSLGGYACLLPCLVRWTLWAAYNECLYNGTPFSPSRTIRKIKSEALLLSLARKPRCKGSMGSLLVAEGLIAHIYSPLRRTTVWVKWMAPPSVRLKLNSNASFSVHGVAGGACLRDASGHLVVGLCYRLGAASSALEAEALALQNAILWCEVTATRPHLVEADSLTLAKCVSSPRELIPWRIREPVLYIRACLSEWGSTIRHVFREANQVADALAEEALNTDPKVFSSFVLMPNKVKLAMMYDLRGFASHRIVRI